MQSWSGFCNPEATVRPSVLPSFTSLERLNRHKALMASSCGVAWTLAVLKEHKAEI